MVSRVNNLDMTDAKAGLVLPDGVDSHKRASIN